MPNHAQKAAFGRSAGTLLLTGFDPFGGDTVNPSWLAVQALDGEVVAGHQLCAALLPTQFGASVDRLRALLQTHQPGMVVCVGQARRPSISIERIAINIDDARIPDNAGQSPIDIPVVHSGPAAYFSTLPIKAMYQTLRNHGISADVSQTAGTFVCNHVFYGLMHALATEPGLRHTRGGFVHVPPLPEQVRDVVGAPSMPLDQIIKGLRHALHSALTTPQDARLPAGALD